MYYQVLLHMNTRYKRRKYMANTIIDVEKKDIHLFKGAGTIVNKVYDETPVKILIEAPKEEKVKTIERLKLHENTEKNLEKLWNRLIDWLLFNLDEIKSYVREMIYLGSGIVSGIGAAPEVDASLELNIIAVDEATKIITAVTAAIKQLEPEDFDIYIDRYHNEMIYSKIAEFEEIAEITVKRHIQKIRDIVKNHIDQSDIDLETIVKLKDKLRNICRKKVA